MFHWPLMVWHRVLNSKRCTTNITDADLFLVPAYRFTNKVKCRKGEEILAAMVKENPGLLDSAVAQRQGPRTILLDGRAAEICPYISVRTVQHACAARRVCGRAVALFARCATAASLLFSPKDVAH